MTNKSIHSIQNKDENIVSDEVLDEIARTEEDSLVHQAVASACEMIAAGARPKTYEPFKYTPWRLGEFLRQHICLDGEDDGQRQAGWKEPQIGKYVHFLLEKLVSHIDSIGCITLKAAPSDDPYGVASYFVTDGKHRLIMAQLLIRCITDAVNGKFTQDREGCRSLNEFIEPYLHNHHPDVQRGTRLFNKFLVSPEDHCAMCRIDPSYPKPDADTWEALGFKSGETPADKWLTDPVATVVFPGRSSRVLLDAYLYIRNKLVGPHIRSVEHAKSLVGGVLNNVIVEVKILGEHVDPLQSFDTINGISLPLSQRDCVRHALLNAHIARAKKSGAPMSRFKSSIWSPIMTRAGNKADDFLHAAAYALRGVGVMREDYHMRISSIAQGDPDVIDRILSFSEDFKAINIGSKNQTPLLIDGDHLGAYDNTGKTYVPVSRFGRLMHLLGGLGVGPTALALLLCEALRDGRLVQESEACDRILCSIEALLYRIAVIKDVNHLSEMIGKGPLLSLSKLELSGDDMADAFVTSLSGLVNSQKWGREAIKANAYGSIALDKKYQHIYKALLSSLEQIMTNPEMGWFEKSGYGSTQMSLDRIIPLGSNHNLSSLDTLGNVTLRRQGRQTPANASLADKLPGFYRDHSPLLHKGDKGDNPVTFLNKELHDLHLAEKMHAESPGAERKKSPAALWGDVQIRERGARICEAMFDVWYSPLVAVGCSNA